MKGKQDGGEEVKNKWGTADKWIKTDTTIIDREKIRKSVVGCFFRLQFALKTKATNQLIDANARMHVICQSRVSINNAAIINISY